MPLPAGLRSGLDRRVRFGDVSYDFHVRHGRTAWNDLRTRLDALDADRFVVVTDAGLPDSLVAATKVALGAVAPTQVVKAQADETEKTLGVLDQLAERALESGITRRSVVVALGGGVIGNIAGLLAALLFRGVRLVHLPTTLLGMSDSVLSLKQAVNSRCGKNHLGTFHTPALVWNNLDFLESLPADETRSALCEMIKNVLGIVPERYDEVAGMLRTDACYSPEDITRFIDLCVDAKTSVMRDDHTEKHEALVLEYGHTTGHAAELLTGGRLRHGFAIGIGMLAAARMSRELGLLDRSDEQAHRRLLELNGAPVQLPEGIDADSVLEVIRLDNKRGYVPGRTGAVDFILLEELGRVHRPDGKLITQVDEDTVRLGIESVLSDRYVLARV
ncbi:2-deoxy-scyllo-inosose synthase [Streptomyces cucumeris]|uniref:2-deoxy-scyllo-inosose synthase n=1 Tax=Streptomyces cucumeris TaxID=2962890 RepID=UPI0020C91310|nr:2-deoxy-scyllo-inosose synthase [Streptomyces sp. NEAU-Y11]MCP9211486.1 2-deoxy-scyllo-inosose synthase [Streptomyces sp. NEAU-Y11]